MVLPTVSITTKSISMIPPNEPQAEYSVSLTHRSSMIVFQMPARSISPSSPRINHYDGHPSTFSRGVVPGLRVRTIQRGTMGLIPSSTDLRNRQRIPSGAAVGVQMIALEGEVRKNDSRSTAMYLPGSPIDSPVSPTGSSKAGAGKKLAPWVSTSSGFSVRANEGHSGMGGMGPRRPDGVEVRRIGV